MKRVSLRIPDDLNSQIEDHIGYGSKSQFLREAAKEKLDREKGPAPEEVSQQN